jgi:hypothetical protein
VVEAKFYVLFSVGKLKILTVHVVEKLKGGKERKKGAQHTKLIFKMGEIWSRF